MKNALVILAGGEGKRIGGTIPKQFKKNGKYNFIEYLLNNISINKFDILVITCKKKYVDKYLKNVKNSKKIKKIIFCTPGQNRQQSSLNSLKKLKKYKPKNVLIHDAARPLCSDKLISKILSNLKNNKAVIPYVNYSDRKTLNNIEIKRNIKNIQTPQGFNFNLIYSTHLKYKKDNFLDDASLIEKLKIKIKYIKGEKTNLKITFSEDIDFFNSFKNTIFKHGIGYDIHQFDSKNNLGLKLCGIKIPYTKLIGHSDADVGIHAICDSILGALSLNDIGHYFKNSDSKWKNANSEIFLLYCKKLLSKKGYYIVNLDINFICETPPIFKYKKKMINNISKLLALPKNIISIKATSNEKIGFIGNNKGIAAESIVQISDEKFY